jgi:hypothetical protein
MNVKEALDHVIGIATIWGENQEEGYTERVESNTTDEECERIADGDDVDDVKRIRDLWLAIEVLDKWVREVGAAVLEAKGEDLKI